MIQELPMPGMLLGLIEVGNKVQSIKKLLISPLSVLEHITCHELIDLLQK